MTEAAPVSVAAPRETATPVGAAAAARWRALAYPAALLGLFLLALALRLLQLQALGGFDWDEVATVYIAARPLPDLLAYVRGAPFEHPPLYYLLAHLWLGLGSDETTLRTLSALLGALTVPLLGALGTRLAGPRVGLLAAALLTVAPAHVFYSRDARMYALLVLLATLSLYALARARQGGRGGWWLVWALSALAALATHYYAAFLIGGELLLALWARRQDPRARLAIAIVALGAVLALAGWWALAPGLRHSLSGLRLQPLPLPEAAESLARALVGTIAGPLPDESPASELALAVVGTLAALAGAVLGGWRWSRVGWIGLLAGLVPLLGLVALMLVGRDLAVRFLLMLLPALLLPLAAVVVGTRPGAPWRAGGVGTRVGAAWRAALPALWAAAALLWLVPYFAHYTRGDYARATALVAAAERPGEAVVFNGPWQTLLFDHYYHGALPAQILTGAVPLVEGQVATALADLLPRYTGIWLLETDMGHADPTAYVPRWLARYGYRGATHDFRQVRVTHYLLDGEPAQRWALDQEYPGLRLVELASEAAPLASGAPARLILTWQVGEEYTPGLKASLRVRDAAGTTWWATDPWVDEGWLAPRSPRPGDRLETRQAIALPPEAPAGPYTLEIVVYRSTDRAASGEGWVAWSAPPLLVALDGAAHVSGRATITP